MARVWAVTWRLLVVAYGFLNVGGVPGAISGWHDFLESITGGKVLGVAVLVAVVVSLLPREKRREVWDRIRGATARPTARTAAHATNQLADKGEALADELTAFAGER